VGRALDSVLSTTKQFCFSLMKSPITTPQVLELTETPWGRSSISPMTVPRNKERVLVTHRVEGLQGGSQPWPNGKPESCEGSFFI
jgi:hypothetical protein